MWISLMTTIGMIVGAGGLVIGAVLWTAPESDRMSRPVLSDGEAAVAHAMLHGMHI